MKPAETSDTANPKKTRRPRQKPRRLGPSTSDILDTNDVESLYKLNKATQATLRYRRQIPFSRIGGRIVRYSRRELEAWFAARTLQPTDGAL